MSSEKIVSSVTGIFKPVSHENSISREVSVYSSHILNLIPAELKTAGNVLSPYFPLLNSRTTTEFFESLRDGVLLAHIIAQVKPSSIDLKQLETGLDMSTLNSLRSKTVFQATANLNLVLNAAKSLSEVVVVNIGANDILECNQDLCLGLVWQLLRSGLVSEINLASHPELIRLLSKGESLINFVALKSEAILLRWVNYHIEKTNRATNLHLKKISNLSSDLSDSSAYIALLQSITSAEGINDETTLKLTSYDPSDKIGRAEKFLEAAFLLPKSENLFKITANDIVSGHARLNLGFIASLFNCHVGIILPSEEEMEALMKELSFLRAHANELEQALLKLSDSNELKLAKAETKVAALEEALETKEKEYSTKLSELLQDREVENKANCSRLQAEFEDALKRERESAQKEITSLKKAEREFKRSLTSHLLHLKNLLGETVSMPALPQSLTRSSTFKQSMVHESSPDLTKSVSVSVFKPAPVSRANTTLKGAGVMVPLGLSSTETNGNEDEIEVLAREVGELARNSLSANRELIRNVNGLSSCLETKEKINEIMGNKIKEYTKLVIDDKKSRSRFGRF